MKVKTLGPLIALFVLLGIGMVWQPNVFLSPEGLRNLFNQNAYTGIIAIGMTIVIVAGGIDLSVGSMMALCGGVCLKAMEFFVGNGQPELAAVALAMGVSLLVGLSCGLVNGLLIVVGGLAPFIATLAGLLGYRSLTLTLANAGEIRSPSNDLLPSFGSSGIPIAVTKTGAPVNLTWGVLIFLAMAVLGHFLLTKTRFGRYTIAVGANERAAVYSAINVAKVKLAGYVLLGGFVGVAAIVQTARMNSVSTSAMGLYTELDAIAAVVIGGTSMSGGKGTVFGTVLGVLILGIINTMMTTSGISPYWQGVVKGVIIILAVLLQRGSLKRA